MQNKLVINQIETLSEKFRDHPLLIACRRAFGRYEADMVVLLFAPEEMFVEAASVIDEILGAPQEAMAYIDTLWDSLKIKIRRWGTGIPQEELNKAVGAVVYVVATVFLLHRHSSFNEDITDALLMTARKNMGIDTDEEQRIIRELASCADDLCEWTDSYQGNGRWLSEDIAEALNQHREKPGTAFLPTGATFTKGALLTDTVIDIICQYLTKAHKLEAAPDDFRKLFSGVNSQFTMKWLGTPGELRDLFKMFTDTQKKHAPYVTPKRGYQLILRSHFVDKDGSIFCDLDSQKSIKRFQAVIDDCEFLIQHITDQFTDMMKELVAENRHALEEDGFFTKNRDDGLRIRKKLW